MPLFGNKSADEIHTMTATQKMELKNAIEGACFKLYGIALPNGYLVVNKLVLIDEDNDDSNSNTSADEDG